MAKKKNKKVIKRKYVAPTSKNNGCVLPNDSLKTTNYDDFNNEINSSEDDKLLISEKDELQENNTAQKSNTDIEKQSKLSDENSDDTFENKNYLQECNIELSEDIVNEKIKSAIDYKNPKKRKKNIIFSICMLALNLIFMVFIVKNLFNEIDGDIFEIFSLQGKKLWWLSGGLFAYILTVIMQIFIYKILLKNFTGKTDYKLSYDLAVVGRYYDNVTPFAIGGQPMQIVTLINNNVSPATATGIPIIKMVINTGMSAIVALIFFLFGLPVLQVASPLNKILLLVVEILGIIGLAITLFITVFMFLISSGTFITRSFISAILRFGYKIKLVKNYRKTYKKVLTQVAEYKFSISYLMKNKTVLLKLILLSFIENVAYALIPFFVIVSLMTNPIEGSFLFFVFICITKYFLCTMASCFIPIPGGTGMMEISFIILFGMIVNENIAWALLIWRFLSYYLVILHGFIHEIIKIISNIYASRKNTDLKT